MPLFSLRAPARSSRRYLHSRTGGRLRDRTRRSSIFAVAFLVAACASPSYVERITLVNGGDFPAEVQVRGGEASGWLTLGRAEDNAETEFREVIDQGETWIFRFDYLGEHQEEVTMTRSDLEGSEWTVSIPDDFASSLRQKGFSPPP